MKCEILDHTQVGIIGSMLSPQLFRDVHPNSANIINMIVGLTALMVVYQTLPILIRSPPPVGFGGDASSIASVQLLYDSIPNILRSFRLCDI